MTLTKHETSNDSSSADIGPNSPMHHHRAGDDDGEGTVLYKKSFDEEDLDSGHGYKHRLMRHMEADMEQDAMKVILEKKSIIRL